VIGVALLVPTPKRNFGIDFAAACHEKNVTRDGQVVKGRRGFIVFGWFRSRPIPQAHSGTTATYLQPCLMA
jgi:hypothetical protein